MWFGACGLRPRFIAFATRDVSVTRARNHSRSHARLVSCDAGTVACVHCTHHLKFAAGVGQVYTYVQFSWTLQLQHTKRAMLDVHFEAEEAKRTVHQWILNRG